MWASAAAGGPLSAAACEHAFRSPHYSSTGGEGGVEGGVRVQRGAQRNCCPMESSTGGSSSFSAGMMPTKPAARGIEAVATPTV